MNDLFAALTGVNPEDVLSEAEIREHLESAFNKFDENKNGRLDKWEFTQAWFFLGLKGTQDETHGSFDKVDSDSSGFVDIDEFCNAIRSDRLMELNLKQLLTKLGVQFDDKEARFKAFRSNAAPKAYLEEEDGGRYC
eukprot:TRINITY_DN1138_c0_g1_i1.p1 TRINITY_DN1138_c0_g1~~TRINITY_DN1138_c0_g1_i1.p1  ORF type:complete len:156 (+),score=39.51 TRINITY_DN1138_c0_g1_i1:59-469(+)